MTTRLYNALAKIADLSLRGNARTDNARETANVYATIEHSPEFTREQMAMLIGFEVWPFDDVTFARPTNAEVNKWGTRQIPLVDVLGRYFPEERKIVLYTNIIAQVAKHLGVSRSILKEVVLVHEIAHAITHFGEGQNGAIWEDFAYAPTRDKELLAQLLSFIWFQQRGSSQHLEAMLQINRSPQDPSYTEYQSVSLAEVKQLVHELRNKPVDVEDSRSASTVDEGLYDSPTLCIAVSEQEEIWSGTYQKSIVVYGDGKVAFLDSGKGIGRCLKGSQGPLHPVELPGRASAHTLQLLTKYIVTSQIMFLPDIFVPTPEGKKLSESSLTRPIRSVNVQWLGESGYFMSHMGVWEEHQDVFQTIEKLVNMAKNEAT